MNDDARGLPARPGQDAPPGGPLARGATGRPPLLNLIGAGILVLVAALPLTRFAPPAATPVPSPTGTASRVTVPHAPDPALAVQDYLDALVSGDARSALAYAARQPADLLMLSDTALAASRALAPITEVRIGHGTASRTATGAEHRTVPVSYHLGDTPVSTTFEVSRVGGAWLLDDVAVTLPLDVSPAAGLRLTVNGTPLARNPPMVFPGRYRVEAANAMYRIIRGTVDVTTTSAGPITTRLAVTLSARGVSAVRRAARTRLAACLTEQSLAPAGCGFHARPPDGRTVRPSTIRWRVVGGAGTLTDLRPRLHTVSSATARVALRTQVRFASTDGRHWRRTSGIHTVNGRFEDGRVQVTFGPAPR